MDKREELRAQKEIILRMLDTVNTVGGSANNRRSVQKLTDELLDMLINVNKELEELEKK